MQRLFQAMYGRLLRRKLVEFGDYFHWLRGLGVTSWRPWADTVQNILYPPEGKFWGEYPFLFEPHPARENGPCLLWRWLRAARPSLDRIETDYYLPLREDALFILSFLSILCHFLRKLSSKDINKLCIHEVPGFGLGLTWKTSQANPVFLVRTDEAHRPVRLGGFKGTLWTVERGVDEKSIICSLKSEQWLPNISGSVNFIQLPSLRAHLLAIGQFIETEKHGTVKDMSHVRYRYFSAEEWVREAKNPDELSQAYDAMRVQLRAERNQKDRWERLKLVKPVEISLPNRRDTPS